MAENQGPISLDVDLTTVDTTIPVLPKGLYDLQIKGMTKEANKTQTGHNLKVELQTTSEITSQQGNPIKPGFKLFMYIPLQTKEGSTFDYRIKLAQLQEAALGEKRPTFNSEELIGKTVRASCKPEDTDEFGLTTRVGRLSKPE
jgi:hypothetical protein